MLSDLRNLPQMFEKIKFEVGDPVKPFQQLMACLPPASSVLVPKPYRYLMTSPDSPIHHFYPTDFTVDMNGKKNPWEGVNLLPFIELNLLKNSIEQHSPDSKLTEVERARNSRGKIFLYTYDMTCNETITSPNSGIGLSDIKKCYSRVTILSEYESEDVSFKAELIPGTQLPFPGFPSLNVLPIASTELVPIGVNVFGFPSKYPTMVLKLHEMPQIPPVEALADNILGKSLFINWPMMHEGKVVAISDELCEVRMEKGKKKVKRFNKIEADRWGTDSEAMMQGYMAGRSVPGSGGVQIGEIKLRIKLLPLQGMKTNPANGSTKKLFGNEEADVPLQLALWQAPAPDPRFVEKGPQSLQDRFPVDCNVVLTKGKYGGCMGTVVGVADAKKVGVKVLTMPAEIPFGLALARSVFESYIPSSDAARILKLHPGLFGKITGSMFFLPGKYDLGLNLKSGDGMCVAGYTRQKKERESSGRKNNGNSQKKAWDSGDSLLVIGSGREPSGGNAARIEERIQWEYTPKAVRLINEYRQKFPQLFTALVRMPNEKKYDATKVFGPNGADWLPVIREWLNNIESAQLPRTPISTDTMSKEAVVAVERAADVGNLATKKKGFPKESLIKIPGSAMYRENSTGPTDVMLASDHNDNEAPELGDRIVNLCASGVQFGARGTVVGIHQATTGCVEVVMDEEFVGGTSLQGLCSNFRGKLCVWAHLMRVTADNSKGLVDKLVPQGSGKAAVDKILSDIERQVKSDTTAPAEGPPTPSQQPQAATTPRSNSADRSRANSALSGIRATSTGKIRSGSTGRGKQGGWREAKGPPEKGIGFKGAKSSGKSGLNQWKNLEGGKGKSASASAGAKSGAQGKAAELKAMLGVTSDPPPSQHVAPRDTQLKAMLGVTSNAPAPQVPAATGSQATAGLKALLGVGPALIASPPPPQLDDFPPPPPPPPQPAAPPSAAEKLLQMMAKQQPLQHMPPPMPGAFNFTYVEEGKETPAPPAQQLPTMGFPPPPPVPMHMQHMQMPMHMPNPPYGHMPPPQMHMQMQMPPPQMHMQMQMPPPQMYTQAPHHGIQPPVPHLSMIPPNQPDPSADGPSVVSDEDFPPLGASPLQAVEGKNKIAAESKKKAPKMKPIVPSKILSKPKK
jgi:5'-3' exoribonuclease 1